MQSRQHFVKHEYRDDGRYNRAAKESVRASVHKPCLRLLAGHERMGVFPH